MTNEVQKTTETVPSIEELKAMKLHETRSANQPSIRILRVPNGWIYTTLTYASYGGSAHLPTVTQVFVPEN